MNDKVDEELALMEERAAERKTIGMELLEGEIGQLCRVPVRTLDVSATIGDAIDLMQEHRFGAVVITREGRLTGILTERDLLMKVIGKLDDYRERPVTAIMTPDPESLRKDDELVYLMNFMHTGGFRHLPIIDEEGKPLHIISLRDVLAYILDHFAEEIQNIPPTPYRGERKRYSG